ncbi:MAG: 2-amino-4-hydroxy-6-hydroxymethyldihydropteridine diphosphokinase [Bacteroidota bacterium]
MIYILLGTNLGNKLSNLSNAIEKLRSFSLFINRTSSIYKTAAWGNTNQDSFLNQVLEIETKIDPQELLKICLSIEKVMGRIRNEKWEARIIDIDILFYNDLIFTSKELNIPHEFLHKRGFTLQPLAELNPNLIHPVLKKTIRELLDNCEDNLRVEKF